MKDQLPLIRSVKSLVAGTLLIAVPYLLFMLEGQGILGPLPAVYASLATLYLLPVAVCTAAAVCGIAAAMLGTGFAMISMMVLTGSQGLMLSFIYVMAVFVAFYTVVQGGVPFRSGCVALIAVHALALSAVYVLAQRMAGGDLYTAAGNAVADFLESWEMGDTMLYQLYSMGLIGLKNELADTALLQVLGGYQLSNAARTDMLLSVRNMVTQVMQSLVPNLLVSRSILGGVGCLLLPLRFGFLAEEKRAFLQGGSADAPEGEKQKVHFPDLGMPPFSLWHLPRGIGWQVGAALAAGYALRLSASPVLNTAGAILYAAASSVFTIQGAAALNFLQKSRGTRRFWRVALPLLLMTTSLLMLMGIFDQFSNFRGLRKPPEPKEEF